MSIEIQQTSNVTLNGVKVLVYGKAGVGKTTLLATASRPIILSCESGLLSLADKEVDYIKVENIDDLMEAYEYLKDNDSYDTICLDSISEIGEVFLSYLKGNTKDPRQAYGELADQVPKMMRKFRDIEGKNVVFVAKVVKTKDENGVQMFQPSMPGQNLITNIPYFFDEVFYMTLMHGDDGDEEFRVIRTDSTYEFEAKDRSGKLKPIERPDLGYIFDKITGNTPVKPSKAEAGEGPTEKANKDSDEDIAAQAEGPAEEWV